ncbi:MAG: GH25 family lysozyme, partial [Calditrichota bacterium]
MKFNHLVQLVFVSAFSILISCDTKPVDTRRINSDPLKTGSDTLKKEISIEGIDVSHHQGEINWSAVKGDSIHFVFMKATEGVTWV